MKKILSMIISAITVFTGCILLSFQAQAQIQTQEKAREKQYFFVSFGSLRSGEAPEEYEKLSQAYWENQNITDETYETEITHGGRYAQIGVGYRAGPDTAIEFGMSDLGQVKLKNTDYNSAGVESGSSEFLWNITTFDYSYLHYFRIIPEVNFSLRVGLAEYTWDDKNDNTVLLTGTGSDKSGSTLLYGFGFETGRISVEYKIYDITYDWVFQDTTYEIYGDVGLVAVGYKF